MNTFRHYLALVYLVTVPPGVLMWLLVHPWIRFWRRVGVRGTYAVILVLSWAGAVGLWLVRRRLLGVDLGTNWPLLILGVVCVAVGGWLRGRLHRHFSNRQLFGVPELAPGQSPQRLVTEGLHAHVRHPRYLQFLLVVAGIALIANHLALYAMLAALVPGLWLVVVLEERELRDRFGPAYAEYSRRVPRFIPRWRGGA